MKRENELLTAITGAEENLAVQEFVGSFNGHDHRKTNRPYSNRILSWLTYLPICGDWLRFIVDDERLQKNNFLKKSLSSIKLLSESLQTPACFIFGGRNLNVYAFGIIFNDLLVIIDFNETHQLRNKQYWLKAIETQLMGIESIFSKTRFAADAGGPHLDPSPILLELMTYFCKKSPKKMERLFRSYAERVDNDGYVDFTMLLPYTLVPLFSLENSKRDSQTAFLEAKREECYERLIDYRKRHLEQLKLTSYETKEHDNLLKSALQSPEAHLLEWLCLQDRHFHELRENDAYKKLQTQLGIMPLELMPDFNEELSQVSDNDSTLTNDYKSKLLLDGYLRHLRISEKYRLKCFRKGFEFGPIPMLSVITGKNGIGKTTLLEAILLGFERILYNQSQYEIDLTIDTKQPYTRTPQVFTLSSSSSTGKISVRRYRNEEIATKNIDQLFIDLHCYDISQRFGSSYQLKFPQYQQMYDDVIEAYRLKVKPPVNSYSFEDFYKEYYLGLRQCFDEKLSRHSPYDDLETYAKTLIKQISDVVAFNEYASLENFRYKLSKACFIRHSEQDAFSLFFEKRNTPDPLSSKGLSPGEKLEVLAQFWQYESQVINKERRGALFLLDEFDAHLHPSLAKEIIEVIQKKLIGAFNIQVILTTHSSTTVSYVPTECLYIMSINSSTKTPMIEKAVTKKQAIYQLTAGTVNVNEPFRLIFVEASNDQKFYELIQNHLISKGILDPRYRLLFTPFGRKSRKSKSNKNSEDSNCGMVKKLVKQLVDEQDADISLADFIYGIVDGDNKKDEELDNLVHLSRYSIENYIYDPIHIYFFAKLRGESLIHNSHLLATLVAEIDDKIIAEKLELPDSLNDLFTGSPIQSKDENTQFILQIIVNAITDRLFTFLQERIRVDAEKYGPIIKGLKRKSSLVNLYKDNCLTEEKTTVEIIDGIFLEYPLLQLYLRGHDLDFIYRQLFPESVGTRSLFEFCKDQLVIFKEFLDIYQYLQSTSTKALDLSKSEKEINQLRKDKNEKNKEISTIKTGWKKTRRELNDTKIKMKELREKIKDLEAENDKLASKQDEAVTVSVPPRRSAMFAEQASQSSDHGQKGAGLFKTMDPKVPDSKHSKAENVINSVKSIS